ncbi:hypothetical protein QBC46DRAFT_337795 [Diplogelasinospora grovesii]|uniref:Uncharacterized protein n=1 Tax=Diplogelasinospora grovesii TaxID=303347 RepID=A0AAN6S8U8_9PEZI|nr:hypothetical protein QBC46DRAFT_337795 [Diplogelasinospora grovesii]
MGAEGKNKPLPLPAPTETECSFVSPTELGTDLGTDVSRPGDDKSSYSLPEDGTPVTIKTGHRASRSQTSLLIEYFEGGKGSSASGVSEGRKPSVRVRLTPSSKHRSRSGGGADRDRIEITQTRSTRRASLSRRQTAPAPTATRSDVELLSLLSGDGEGDASSYASATEESNVSRNPIDIEIDRGGNVRSRRRPASPLIPDADSNRPISYVAPTVSEISAIPTDSFLDGSPPTASVRMSEVGKRSRSRSPSRSDFLAGAASGLATAAAVDRLRNKSRDESRDRDRERERVSVSKTRDKDKERSSNKHKSGKSRTTSRDEKYAEESKSSRRKSGRGHTDSMVSGAESSVLSSNLAPSHRSADQHSVRSAASKASSINNPKLLETVEDAIRRLILPELNALKREQSKHSKDRRGSSTSSTTTASKEDYTSDRRRSAGTDKNVPTPRDSMKSRERRDREARHDFDDSPAHSAVSHESVEDLHHIDDTPMRSTDRLKSATAAAVMGVAAVAAHEALKSPSDDKRTRRRRRAEMRSRASDQIVDDDHDSDLLAPPAPPMPLMDSDINPSEVTRASILSASADEDDRPHSASEELTPNHDDVMSAGPAPSSPESSPTPTRTPITLQALGTQHANVSHGDLRALPRGERVGDVEEYEINEYGQKEPGPPQDYDDDDYDEAGPMYAQQSAYDSYYGTQHVPPPLKYTPYQPERRGLSPIPSISGYTEGGSEPPNRDSRVTQHTSDSVSSPRHDEGSLHSPNSVPSHVMSREFVDDDLDHGSELDRVQSGQAVRAVGANPNFIHPAGIESNVASLVEGSMLEGSQLTNGSSIGGDQHYNNNRQSMATLEEERSQNHGSPVKQRSVASHQYEDERGDTPVSGSQRSREFQEYDVDEYGRKIPTTTYRQSPTASEQAITSAAVGAAAAVLRAQHGKDKQHAEVEEEEEYSTGLQRNQSFKERARNGQRPGIEPKHSVDRLEDHERPKLGFNSLPDPHDPMPEIGNWQDDDLVTNPSLLNGKEGHHNDEEGHWPGDATPRQQAQDPMEGVEYEQLHEGHRTPPIRQNRSGHGMDAAAAAAAGAAAAVVTAAAMNASQNHSRQPSQEQDDEWYRTSDDKKRDTLVTNPYEGTSPIANLGGLNDNLLGPGYDNRDYAGYATRSPLGHKVDEGYISQGPNKTPDGQNRGKGVDFQLESRMGGAGEDPFYVSNIPKDTRRLSGMSQGMGSPLYDASTGHGIDRIESKDIIALMQHLMVRDAQRSARDTEILVTLVRAAAEMRNNFEDLKKMLADTEDVIITEVKENTEKTVQRAINGPRPYPGSAARSLQGRSEAGTVNGDEVNAKKRSIFRRALKGLSAKGANDLGRIEDMLMQLLTEVDVLKAQTAPGTSPVTASGSNRGAPSFEQTQPEEEKYEQYEQEDHGYEPEGNAGTSTASHTSQSGHLSVQSRGTSGKLGYDRKSSAHRISTVPEDNEDEYDHHENANDSLHYGSKADMLMTPAQDQRGSSVPLATPPATAQAAQASMSNENTPRTEEGKKKSGGRSSWFPIPKISRWSETTTSSVAQVFRRSKQKENDDEGNYHSPTAPTHSAPSRAGSIGSYSDNFQFSNPHPTSPGDKLHTGFSEVELSRDLQENDPDFHVDHEDLQPPPPLNYVSMTPEDPKYKAHRNSLNLVHPQPRQGQTERFKQALESQAMGFDSPLSPKSADWAGSATSLNRFPRNSNRDSYGSGGDQQYQQHWTSSPAAASLTATSGPPRPPKEPLDHQLVSSSPGPHVGRATPPKHNRLSKLQKQPNSPLPHHSVESGYGTMTHGVPTASYISHGRDSRDGGSPRLENRNLSGALGNSSVSRRPSGPRPMTPKSVGSNASGDVEHLSGGESRRKRDTFGTITSQDTDTF